MYMILTLALLTTAFASPLNPSGPSASPKAPIPTVTEGPTLARRFTDPVETLTSTYTELSCTPTEDPDRGVEGCACNNGLMLPFSTYVSAGETTSECPWTEWTSTATSTSTNPYPYTITSPNRAVVAYASIGTPAGTPIGYGASTTIQAGTSLSLELNPSSSVNVGWATAASEQSSLYTALSNALTSGCPMPSSSASVTSCGPIPAITGIQYFSEGYLGVSSDGKLETTIEEVSISTEDGYYALINTLASGIATSANNPNNSESSVYYQPGDVCDSPICWSGNASFTNVPATLESFMTVQTNDTGGAVTLQNLGISLLSVEGGSSFGCSDASLVLSGMAAAASLIGGFYDEGAIGSANIAAGVAGSLGLGTAGSFGRFGLSVGCDAPSF